MRRELQSANSGGSIGLAGGTITGNQSEGIVNEAAEITGGAIYSLGEIRVSGAVIVKDNKDDGLNDNSIVLGGDNACIAAIGQLAETADLQVRRSDAAAGKIIMAVSTGCEWYRTYYYGEYSGTCSLSGHYRVYH